MFEEGKVTVIAGPCAVESREQVLRVAEALSSLGLKILRGGAYKPRTSPYTFQGLEEEGLKILQEAKEKYGLIVVTEITDTEYIPLVLKYADIIQVGARNMDNYALLKKVGKATAKDGRWVLLKRGFAATIKEWLLAAEYITLLGCGIEEFPAEQGVADADGIRAVDYYDVERLASFDVPHSILEDELDSSILKGSAVYPQVPPR